MHLRFQEIRALRRQKRKGDSVGQWHPCHKHRTELDDAVSYSVPWWRPRTRWQTHSDKQALDGAKKWCPNRQLVMAQLGLRLKKSRVYREIMDLVSFKLSFLHINSSASLWINWAALCSEIQPGRGPGVEVLVDDEPLFFRDVGWTSGLRLAQEDGHPIGKDCIYPTVPGPL